MEVSPRSFYNKQERRENSFGFRWLKLHLELCVVLSMCDGGLSCHV